MTKTGTIRLVVERHVLSGSPLPNPKGAGEGPVIPRILGTLPVPKRFDLERPNLA